MQVGRIDIVPVLDGVARLPIELAVNSQAGSRWSCVHQPLDASGRIRMDIGSFLVHTKDRVILVDLGLGPEPIHPAFVTGGLLDNLRRAGVAPGDVTDVIFTHMHIDHVGWSTVQGKPTFPNATYRVHVADWEHFMTGPVVDPTLDPLVREMVSPIEGQLDTFDDEVELAPGLRARPAPGHTPGSTILLVCDAGERALLLGDVAHTVAELTDPEWEGVADIDRDAANAMRRRITDELVETGDPFAAAHLPDLSFGRLFTAAGVRQFAWA